MKQKPRNKRKRQYFKRNKYCCQSNILLTTIPNRKSIKPMKATQQLLLEKNILPMTAQQSSTYEHTYCHYFDNGSNIDPTLYLTDYSIISNITFQKTLLSAVATQTRETKSFIKSLVINEETTTFIRQLTQLINKSNYLKLQTEQWNYYHHLGMTEGIWTGRVSKKLATIFSMCYVYGRSRTIVEQRQKKFQLQLTQLHSDINEYLAKKPSSITGTDKIISILTDLLIITDQYPLRIEFERRRGILKFDAKDHQYIANFNDLKPQQSDIYLTKSIWKATNDEQTLRYEIAIFKNWFNYKLNNQSGPTLEELHLTNIEHIFNKLHSLKKQTDHQLSKDLAEQILIIAEQKAQSYATKIGNYKDKLKTSTPTVEPCSQIIQTIIQDRQQNMLERTNYHTKMKIQLAFTTRMNNPE